MNEQKINNDSGLILSQEGDCVTRPRFVGGIHNASISPMINTLPPLDGPPLPPVSDDFAYIVNHNTPTPQEFLFAIMDNIPEGLPATWKEIIESNEKSAHQDDFKFLSDGAIPGSNERPSSILKSFDIDATETDS